MCIPSTLKTRSRVSAASIPSLGGDLEQRRLLARDVRIEVRRHFQNMGCRRAGTVLRQPNRTFEHEAGDLALNARDG